MIGHSSELSVAENNENIINEAFARIVRERTCTGALCWFGVSWTLRTAVAEATLALLGRPVSVTDELGELTINHVSRTLEYQRIWANRT